MSNRSYDVGRRARLALTLTFNSPWECRIGLTEKRKATVVAYIDALSIPRGNVE